MRAFFFPLRIFWACLLLALIELALCCMAYAQTTAPVYRTRGGASDGDVAGQTIFGIPSGTTFIFREGSLIQLPASVSRSILDASLGNVRGSIAYRGASGWVGLAPGTAGHALLSGGVGADPYFGAVAAGGGTWGTIAGTLSNQTDLQAALAAKQNAATAVIAVSPAPAANRVLVSGGANREAVATPVTIDPNTGAMTIPELNVEMLVAGQFNPADRTISPAKIAQDGAISGQALVWNGDRYAPATVVPGNGAGDVVVTSWPSSPPPGTFYFNTSTSRRRYYANANDYWESPPYTFADATAPVVLSAVISTVGSAEILTLNASESLVDGVGGTAGVTVSLSGGAATATYSTGDGTNALTYALSRRIAAVETGTMTYVQPGNGWEDASGNDLATLSGFSVTNQSSYLASASTPTVLDTVWSTSAATTVTLDATGAADGALLVAVIGTISTGSISIVPDGWTLLHSVDAGNSSNLPLTVVYTKVASGAEGVYTWTMGVGNRYAAFVLDCGDVVVADTAITNNSPTLGVISVPAGGIALAIASRAAASNTADAVVPSGYTELVDIFGTGYRAGASAAWRSITGDTNGTDTYDDATASDSTVHIALAP